MLYSSVLILILLYIQACTVYSHLTFVCPTTVPTEYSFNLFAFYLRSCHHDMHVYGFSHVYLCQISSQYSNMVFVPHCFHSTTSFWKLLESLYRVFILKTVPVEKLRKHVNFQIIFRYIFNYNYKDNVFNVVSHWLHWFFCKYVLILKSVAATHFKQVGVWAKKLLNNGWLNIPQVN